MGTNVGFTDNSLGFPNGSTFSTSVGSSSQISLNSSWALARDVAEGVKNDFDPRETKAGCRGATDDGKTSAEGLSQPSWS